MLARLNAKAAKAEEAAAKDLVEGIEPGEYGDEWYLERVRNGAIRDGVTYMPAFAEPAGPLSQEALWAIRAWLETLYDENL